MAAAERRATIRAVPENASPRPPAPRPYADLAPLWPLLSPPDDYPDEGARLRA